MEYLLLNRYIIHYRCKLCIVVFNFKYFQVPWRVSFLFSWKWSRIKDLFSRLKRTQGLVLAAGRILSTHHDNVLLLLLLQDSDCFTLTRFNLTLSVFKPNVLYWSEVEQSFTTNSCYNNEFYFHTYTEKVWVLSLVITL